MQLQAKITNFYIQVNDPRTLGTITDIRLKQLQTQEWLRFSPLFFWPHNEVQKKHYTSFIAATITLCHSQGFTFNMNSNKKNEIISGNVEIREILGNSFNKKTVKQQLRSRNLMYIDQLTTVDGCMLLNWNQITTKSFNTRKTSKGKIPQWFKELEQNIFQYNDGQRIIQPTYRFTASHFKGTLITTVPNNRSQPFITIWNPIIRTPIIGRVIIRQNQNAIIEHWILNEELSLLNEPIIKKCHGCWLHNTIYSLISTKTGTLSCANIYTTADAVVIKKVKKLNQEYKLFSSIYELFQQAEYHMKFKYGLHTYYIPSPVTYNTAPNIIQRFLQQSMIHEQLLTIQQQLQHASTLEFYTDGSLKDSGRESVSISFAIIQTDPSAPYIEFSATVRKWPSAARAELSAMLFALLVSPQHSTITIHTDAQCIINQFEILKKETYPFRPRVVFKLATNSSLWNVFFEVLESQQISLSLLKVPAHSTNFNNNKVDLLAKQAHSTNIPTLTILPHYVSSIIYFPLWNNNLVEVKLRLFITQLSEERGFENWINLHRNTKYRRHEGIDWTATFFILNNNEKQNETSPLATNIKAHKIKLLLEELPTIEHMKKRRPDLYNNWTCPTCNNHQETFTHIWSCPKNQSKMAHIMLNSRKKLITLIKKNTTHAFGYCKIKLPR